MQVNRRNIIHVTKVTEAVLAQIFMGEISIHSVSVIIFAMRFSPKLPTDQLGNRRGPPVFRGPQFEEHRFR
jgi:hypothetical protein